MMTQLKNAVTANDHMQGNAQALVTLVEYGDYQCPACGEAYPVVKRLQEYFGKDLCFVFRNFPLTEVHPQAEAAAELAEFADMHGQFWQAHDALYENQELLGPTLYLDLVKLLHLSLDDLRQAVEEGSCQARVRADFTGGVRSGVNGTPTFFINGRRHDGGLDLESLAAAIEAYR
jgi:protein-disulfide isomerase